jgi:hypothetical protein
MKMIDSSTSATRVKKDILNKENAKKTNGNYDSDFSDYTTKEKNKKKYSSSSSRSPTPGLCLLILLIIFVELFLL